jgi:hypothetical protein
LQPLIVLGYFLLSRASSSTILKLALRRLQGYALSQGFAVVTAEVMVLETLPRPAGPGGTTYSLGF